MNQLNQINNVTMLTNSNVVNNENAKIDSQVNTIYNLEPLVPVGIFQCYREPDYFFFLYSSSLVICTIAGFFITIDGYYTMLLVGLVIGVFKKLVHVFEMLMTYNNYFIYDGIVVPFDIVDDISFGRYHMYINYNKQKIVNDFQKNYKLFPKLIYFLFPSNLKRFRAIYNKNKSDITNNKNNSHNLNPVHET